MGRWVLPFDSLDLGVSLGGFTGASSVEALNPGAVGPESAKPGGFGVVFWARLFLRAGDEVSWAQMRLLQGDERFSGKGCSKFRCLPGWKLSRVLSWWCGCRMMN